MLWVVMIVVGVLWLVVLVPPMFDRDRRVMQDVERHQETLAALGKVTRR